MKEEVLDNLIAQHDRTGGHCGIHFVELSRSLQIASAALKSILNELFKEQKITAHDSVHSKLIKYKPAAY